MRARVAFAFMVTGMFAIGGCAGGDHADLERFKAELEQRRPPVPEPLPGFEPYEPFAYGAGNLRSPFTPPQEIRLADIKSDRPQVEPDPDRRREYLEQFSIAELTMVGTLSNDRALYGLIEDPEGGVHRVRPGDHMGGDHGRVEGISETGIELVEIVSDGVGGWVERSRTVSLGGGGS